LPVLDALVEVARRGQGSDELDEYVVGLVCEARSGRSLTSAEAIVVDVAGGFAADLGRAA
jgi:hypothetical protein